MRIILIIFMIIDFVINGFIGSFVWNNTISNIFNISEITFWQAIAISLFSLIFIKQIDYKEHDIDDNISGLITDIIYKLIIFIFTFIIVIFNLI